METPQTFKRLLAIRLEWLDSHHYSSKTIQAEKIHLEKFVRWSRQREVFDFREVTLKDLQSYQRWLGWQEGNKGQAWSVGYQRQLMGAVCRLFSWAKKEGFLLANPAKGVEPIRSPHLLPLRVLSIEEIERVLRQANLNKPNGLRDRAMMEILYASALRRQELLNLKKEDLDHDRRLLWVREGKGRKDRVVPISRRALYWISQYEAKARSSFLPLGKDSDLLFLNPQGETLKGELKIKKYISQALPQKEGSCHLFRHSVATILLEQGCDIRLLQEFLGHSRLDTTQRYLHIRPQELKKIIHSFHPLS